MVPLKTPEILACLREVSVAREPDTQLHLLGITRCSNISEFASYGVTSFDSTSAFRQAFKDDKDNYHTMDRTYTAIRVPQVDGLPKLKKQILAGKVDQELAIQRERACLRALQEYDVGKASAQHVIDALQRYNDITGLQDLPRCVPRCTDGRPMAILPMQHMREGRNQCDTIPRVGTQ